MANTAQPGVRAGGERPRRAAPAPAGWLQAVRTCRPHVLAVGSFLLLAIWVTGRLWVAPDTRLLADNVSDQPLLEWMLAYGAHAVTHLTDPFYSHQVNAPEGANLMANSSVILPAVVLTPVTLVFGPATSFLVLAVVALAGTATGWYLVFCRHLVRSPVAAALGAGLIGFSPGMISLSNAHLHLTSQFFVPFIVLCALPGNRARAGSERPPTLRRGVLLGALVAAQCLTGTEILLFTVLGVAVFVALRAALSPHAARRELPAFLARIGTAALVSLILLAYPLWMLLAGPGSYHGTPWHIDRFGTDVVSWVWFGTFAVFGSSAQAGRVYADSANEQTSFLGPGLVILLAALVWWLRRSRLVLALAGTALLFAVLSFGTRIVYLHQDTGIPGPWALLARLPLVEQAIPDRLALVTLTAAGAVLALGTDRALRSGLPRPLLLAALAAALVPILPTQLPVRHREPVPEFFTSGRWREHVRPGHVLLPVPQRWRADRIGLRWSAGTLAELAVAGGPVMVPDAHGAGEWARPRSRLATSMARVSATGHIPAATPKARARARRDLAGYRTDCVALDPHAPHAAQVRTALDRWLGIRGRYLSGVWIWDVH